MNNNGTGYFTPKYNWNAPLESGTVVASKYNDFDGNERTGLFVVIYDEQLDNTLMGVSKNAMCLKISSQATLVSNYSVEINREFTPFLDKPSIVCCSKMHLLHKKSQIYNILGYLDKVTYRKVCKIMTKFMSEMQRQFIDKI